MLGTLPDDDAPAIRRRERQRWMGVLARAKLATLETLLRDAPALPPHIRLRGPEAGLVMMRGRMGGGGGAFNVGEISVTRCTVRADGQIGHAYVAGRDLAQAELAARIDAALQDDAMRDALMVGVVARLERMQAVAREGVAERAAATKVQFFTMATMRS